jgi:hypothetical protein
MINKNTTVKNKRNKISLLCQQIKPRFEQELKKEAREIALKQKVVSTATYTDINILHR